MFVFLTKKMDWWQHSSLEGALKGGEAKLGELLIYSGAFLDKQSCKKALDIAISRSYIEVVKLLVELGFKPADKFKACINSNLEILDYLYGKKVVTLIEKDRKEKMSLIFKACELGRIDLFEYLLEKGIKIESQDKYGHTPICNAIKYGHHKLVELMIKKGANINARSKAGDTPIIFAIYYADTYKKLDILKYVVLVGANINNINNNGLTPFSFMGSSSLSNEYLGQIGSKKFYEFKGNFDIALLYFSNSYSYDLENINMCLKKGANVNVIDHWVTPLWKFLKSSGNRKPILELLIKWGADVNFINRKGLSPLIYELYHEKNKEIVKLLILSGANLDITNHCGFTPLLIFIQEEEFDDESIELLDLFISKGSNVNHIANQGVCPLSYAVEYGIDNRIIKHLIDNGAILNSQAVPDMN